MNTNYNPKLVHGGRNVLMMHHDSDNPNSGKPTNTSSGWYEADTHTPDEVKHAMRENALERMRRGLMY